jgi:hypothetical protein
LEGRSGALAALSAGSLLPVREDLLASNCGFQLRLRIPGMNDQRFELTLFLFEIVSRWLFDRLVILAFIFHI